MRLAHYFIVLLFVLVLSACSDGTNLLSTVEVPTIVAIPAVVQQQAPSEPVVASSTAEPVKVICDVTSYVPCGNASLSPPVVNEVCNFNTYIPCYALPPICDASHVLVMGICEVKVIVCAQSSSSNCSPTPNPVKP
jgi:hypothetical protein